MKFDREEMTNKKSEEIVFDEQQYVFSMRRFATISFIGLFFSLLFVLEKNPAKAEGYFIFVLLFFLLILVLILAQSYLSGTTFSTYGRINIIEHNIVFSFSQVVYTALSGFLIYQILYSLF